MDDQGFDDSIKNKVGEYNDPNFDPSALAALHQQMASVSIMPWYSHYRTEVLLASGLIASTIVILWSQWFLSQSTTEKLNEKIAVIQNQQSQIDKQQNEILMLKNTPPDTVRIIEIREQPSPDYAALLYRIRLLELESSNRAAIKNEEDTNQEIEQSPNLGFSQDTESTWNKNELSPTGLYGNSHSSRVSPKAADRKSIHAKADDSTMLIQPNSKNLSAKTIRDIEKHYQKGIGIRIGPMLELGKGFYDLGGGEIGLTWGALGDFIVSPSLSIEAGLKYAHRVYDISEKNELTTVLLPGMDQSLGTLNTIDVDSWIFEVPINLKYRYPLSIKTHWVTGIGYSSILYGKQLFEYEYEMDSNPDATISSTHKTSSAQMSPGALNFSIGLSRQLKNKKSLETSIYYQLGLGNAGIEKNSVNYLGVRGVYWFTVR